MSATHDSTEIERRTDRAEADRRALHGFLFMACFVLAACVPVLRGWPWLWFAPLVGYATIVAAVPGLRRSFPGWPIGRTTARTVTATAFVTIASCCALVAFHFTWHPSVEHVAAMFPLTALGSIVWAGIVFCLLNALCEEIVFRAILFNAFDARFGPWGAVMATSLLFGYGHLGGYPPGLTGAILAGIYALALGWLRLSSGGILWPFFAHVAADATIFWLVVHTEA